MTFIFHVDAGHAWLQVTQADLKQIGLKASDFSRYSFVGPSGQLYLEEDCDLSKFANRFEVRRGNYPIMVESYSSRSFVRDLPRNETGY